MKKYRFLLIIVVVFAIFTLPAAASEGTRDYISDFENILPEGAPDLSDSGALTSSLGIEGLLSIVLSALSGEGSAVLSFFLLLLGTALLSYISSLLSGGLGKSVGSAVGILTAAMIFRSLYPVFSSAMDTVDKLSSFFSLAVPIMTGVTLSGGGASTAAASALGMNFSIAIIAYLAEKILLPLITFSFALGLLSSLGDDSIRTLAGGIKGAIGWLVGIVTALLVGTLSLQTVVATAADSAAMRAAKYAAQGMIPVVGGTVSGALSTLASGLSYAKGVIGAGAVWVMLTTAISPLILMLLYRLALTLAASFSDAISAGASQLLAFRYAADTAIGVYSLSVLTYIFEIILFILGGVPLL